MPSTSEGNISLVNWMRWKVQSMARASAWPSVVLPTPGTPSISKWPLAKIETKARRRTSSFPRITRRRLFSSSAARREVATRVSGAIVGILLCWSRCWRLRMSSRSSQFSVKPNILRGCWSQRSVARSPTIWTGGIMGRSYRDLIAWQKAMKFVSQIYEVTQRFPSEERYGLTNQLRRAAVSVPSNIAEGQARFSQKEFHHFLSQARGSLTEIETQLLIAKDLKYLPSAKAEALLAAADELGRV